MIQQQFYSIVTVVKWDAPKSLLKREFLLYLLYQDSTVFSFEAKNEKHGVGYISKSNTHDS